MRVLVYAMPSSGASLFCSFLAQVPDSIAIIDMWSLVPPLRSEYPIIVKVTLDLSVSIDDHLRSFEPDLRILYLRRPRDNYQSLNSKHYRDLRGSILQKLQILDQAFARRSELFDLVIRYEDFVRNPQELTSMLQANGLAIPDNARDFRRGPRQIAQFARDHCEWCRRNYLDLYGFGNQDLLNWGTLKTVTYPPPSEETLAAIAAACPSIEADYFSSPTGSGKVLVRS